MSIPQRFDGYVRVSRVSGRSGDGFISPAVQREQIQGWARLRKVEIVEWHEDLDQSGGKLQRPGLDRLLNRIDTKETDGIAVAKLDRLSRLGVADALKLVERITSAGGTIAAVDLGLDPTTPFGEFGMTIMLAMGRMERRRLTDAWASAQSRALRRGAKVSPTPFGYQRETNGVIVPGPDADHVRRAYQLAGGDLADATRYLQQHAPGRFWTTSTVRRMLRRRSYLGEATAAGSINVEAHEPLVDRRTWEAAQQPVRHRRASGAYPLSGVATCGTCGAGLVGGARTGGGNRRAYRCRAGQTLYKGVKCGTPAAIVADNLEAHARTLLEPVLAGLTVKVADDGQELADAEATLLDAERELDDFAADLTIRRALGSKYHAHLQARVEAVDDAQDTYRTLAQSAQATGRLTAEEALDDPEILAIALGSMGLTLRVNAGRAPVEQRVALVPLDDQLAAREPAAADG